MQKYPAKTVIGLILLAASAALLSNFRAGQIASADEKPPAKPKKIVAVLGQPFEVEIGKSIVIPAQKLDVHFERVLEDSRCPRDVECVWAGQISVAIEMKNATQKLGAAQLTLQENRHVTPKSIGKIGPYYVKLLEVAPERASRSSGTAQRIALLVQNKPFATPKNRR